MEPTHSTVHVLAAAITEVKCAECGRLLDLRGLQPLTRFACGNCGAEKTVPGRFGQYILLDQIGRGGMGAVYRGMDPLLDRPVAVKVLLKSLRDKPDLYERFRHEAKAAAGINHPHVAHVYSFGEQDGQPYIVMEYVAGKSLDRFMEAEKSLDEAFVIKAGMQIAEGLQAGAKIGLVHGDVKPENILFDVEYSAKLIDFGLATFADEEVMGGLWGSPYYISPERIERRPADERSDIYSLGASLYHALAGRPPFDGESAVEVLKVRLKKPPPPITRFRRHVHPETTRIVSRMMSLDVSVRYPNYPSLIGDLRSALAAVGHVSLPTARLSKRFIRPSGGPARSPEPPVPQPPTGRANAIRHGTERRGAPEPAARRKRTGRTAAVHEEAPGARWAVALLILLILGALVYALSRSEGCSANPSPGTRTIQPAPWDQVPPPGRSR